MIVYRAENKRGEGIYNNSTSRPLLIYHDNQPCPDQDGIEFGYEHYFGFKNLEQYKAWVSTDNCRKNLKRSGYHITVYVVSSEHVLVGKTQVAFRKEKAKKVVTLDPISLR